MTEAPPTPVIHCPKCGKPMQIMSERVVGDKVISRTYICGCVPGIFYHTVRY